MLVPPSDPNGALVGHQKCSPSINFRVIQFIQVPFLSKRPCKRIDSRTCLNNVPENRAHLNYVPKVPKMGHKLGTKSAPPQSLPQDRNFGVLFRVIQFIQAKLGFFSYPSKAWIFLKIQFLGGPRGKFFHLLTLNNYQN